MSKLEIRGFSSNESTTNANNANLLGGINLSGAFSASGSSFSGGNFETHQGEPKKFNLLEHSLVMEGTLSIRVDASKQTTVLVCTRNFISYNYLMIILFLFFLKISGVVS